MSEAHRIDESAALLGLAKKLRGRRPWYFLPYYHLFWEAVCWTGEVPWRLTEDEQCVLGALVYYRTMKNLGRPDADEWATLWERAREAFPWWAGFAASRNRSSRWFRYYFATNRRATMNAFLRSLEESDAEQRS